MNNYSIVIRRLGKSRFWRWCLFDGERDIGMSTHIEGKNEKKHCVIDAIKVANDLKIDLYEEKDEGNLVLIEK
jgi:hypothetical protein